ncbi:MAG: hypothetical protein KAQ88_02710, partial [Hyphomicrobiaceae bacterium]|nr:hypothetical protein [Hyphomicrobiaceae bacterium]
MVQRQASKLNVVGFWTTKRHVYTRLMVPLISAFLAANARIATRVNVRFGSKADIWSWVMDVRFTPESGHTAGCTKCPLSAKS